jgi:hypothetical protein
MPNAALEISYDGESRSTPTLRNITIKVALANGKYVPQPNEYTLVVFYGRPPNYGNDYPVTDYYLYTNSLEFSGDLNSVYSVAQVESADASIKGTITASQPLPYTVTIGLPGTGQVTTLEPGQTSVAFNIGLTPATADAVKGVVTAKLSSIQPAE